MNEPKHSKSRLVDIRKSARLVVEAGEDGQLNSDCGGQNCKSIPGDPFFTLIASSSERYADEKQEQIQMASPLDTKFTWGALLYSNQNLGSLSVFRCPAYPPYVYTNSYTNWFSTYGVWSDPPDSVMAGEFHQDLVVSTIQNPVNYLHLADTTSRGRQGLGGVQFQTFRTNAQMEVHARHNGAANGWFFDGHVEGMKRTRLEELHIVALFGPDTIPSYFP